MRTGRTMRLGALVTAVLLGCLLVPGNALRLPRRARTVLVDHPQRVDSCPLLFPPGAVPVNARSSPTATCLQLRGGGVGGILVALLRTILRNPVLLVLMLTSSLLVAFEQDVPYAKFLQALAQTCLVAYCFYLLVQWQAMQIDAESS